MRDLVVLAPDVMWKAVLEAILARHEALELARPLAFEIIFHPGQRDGGVRAHAGSTLQAFAGTYAHALAVMDHAGCGDDREPTQVEADLNEQLRDAWGERASALVVAPELESWLIGGAAHFGAVSSRASSDPRTWMRNNGLWATAEAKPLDPKQAIEAYFHRHGVRPPISSANYRKIAARASLRLDRCRCDSFHRFVMLLRGWFNESPADTAAAQN